MMQAYLLESIAAPGTMTWRINGVGPESFVHASGVLDVAQVEQGEEVGELIYCISLFLVDGVVAADEIAVAEIIQYLR